VKYLSVCSGIEAATVAWHSLGWKPVGFSEIELFPSAVLAHHYPNVTNFGDMTKYKEWNIETDRLDILVGGTPCQSFSVAGLRKGLDDPRGNLALVYCGILDHFRPQWFVWENVPGVLSSSGGRDFGSFLGALAELGYGFAYRVLDAQFFGVAQRRRRVFVVGYLGDWRPPTAVLFERESLRRDTAPSREKGERIAPCVTNGPPFSRTGNERVEAEAMVVQPFDVANCLTQRMHKGINTTVDEGQTPVLQPIPFNIAPGKGDLKHDIHVTDGQVTKTLDASGSNPSMHQGGSAIVQAITAPTLTATNDPSRSPQSSEVTRQVEAVHQASMAVRRLTPVECERLQGFPDNYTNIPWRKKEEAPDGPRYKALGNSMAVPVMRWIGQRIKIVVDM
jgi:DNA (cytosine-5)-methyltransferase 1